MTESHEDDHEDDHDDHDVQELKDRAERLRVNLAKQRVENLAAFDQFVAYLHDLEHTMDDIASMQLPAGQRIELIRALSNLVQGAIIGMEDEGEPPPGRLDIHTETVGELEELVDYARQKRLENRARNLAHELSPDDYEKWKTFTDVVNDPSLLDQLAEQAGLEPSDAVIRAWLLKNASRRRRTG